MRERRSYYCNAIPRRTRATSSSLARARHIPDASGRVLLAFQNDDERMRRLAKALAKSPSLMTEAEFLQRLKIVRLQGFEEMASLQISGVHNLSFPVSTPAAMRSPR